MYICIYVSECFKYVYMYTCVSLYICVRYVCIVCMCYVCINVCVFLYMYAFV